MRYTYNFLPSSSMNFQGKKARALKLAREYNMYIKLEKNGFFVLVKNAEAVIYEYDDNNNVVRQADVRPYIRATKRKLTVNTVQAIVDSLNAGDISFDDVLTPV